MAIPLEFLQLYNLSVRAVVYILLAIAIYVFFGRDGRHARKGYESNVVAVISVVTFGIVILIVSILFGAGRNAYTASVAVVLNNLWAYGLVIILGEYIRYKLIRSADHKERDGIVVTVTIVLALGQMNALHTLIHGSPVVSTIFFEFIFPPLVISAVASYFVVKESSILSVIAICFVYGMVPYLMPVLPHVAPLVISLIICGLVFISGVVLYFVSSENRALMRRREKRARRYEKKPVFGYVTAVVIVFVVIAFIRGAFPIYPLVVLTGSMAGTFERGSIVFVQRAPPGQAYAMVGEGYVIHFANHLGVDYIHRVVDFGFDEDGRRTYVTQGDAAYLIDARPVGQEDVLGVARTFIPLLGWPYIFVRAVLGQ